MGVSGRQPPDLGGMSVGLFLALGAWFMAGRSFWLGRGQLAGQTWRSGRVWVQPAERLLPGTDEHPTVAAVAAAASCSPCGSSHLHHQLPTGLEPSSRPGQGAGGDLWRMTVESPKGGEGLCHRGHSTVPQPGDEAPPWGRPRTRAVKPKLPGTRANPTQPNDPGRDQCAGTGARLLPQVGAGSSGAPRVPVGAR